MKKVLPFLFLIFLITGALATFTVTVNSPNGGETVGESFDLNVNIIDTDSTGTKEVDMNVYISNSSGAKTLLVLEDLNVTEDKKGYEFDPDDVNLSEGVWLTFSVTTAGIRNDGCYFIDADVTDVNTSGTDSDSSDACFNISREYAIENDVDVNKYSTQDIQDLSRAGVGTSEREVVINMPLLILGIALTIVISLIALLVAKAKMLKSQVS